MKYRITVTPSANAKKIELIQEIRWLNGMGLKEAKELVESGKPFTVEAESYKGRNKPPVRSFKQPEHFLRIVTELLGCRVKIDPPLKLLV